MTVSHHAPPASKPKPAQKDDADPDLTRIVGEEEKVLARVMRTVTARSGPKHRAVGVDYDAELVALRDQIREARAEDIPPLVEEMERITQIASRRSQVVENFVDPSSPYFGRLVIHDGDRKREVLIGRRTFLDGKTGVRIVDWRDAPISRIYYRYEEGDDFDEMLGSRMVEGDVLTRRTLSIGRSKLRRIGTPQGTFKRKGDEWRRADASATALSGGQGAAMRAEAHHKIDRGKLGVGADGDGGEDKHLAEITALIDPVQFDLITKPSSGLVVIQGGAGSGKTTIGLHRLAYLAFQDKRRFRPDNMLVLVFNQALVRYISRVLPALGVEGVHVITYENWASQQRARHFPHLPRKHNQETPSVVVRFKKHPVVLKMIDGLADRINAEAEETIVNAAKTVEGGARAIMAWRSTVGTPLARAEALRTWLRTSEGKQLHVSARHKIDQAIDRVASSTGDIIGTWAEMLTNRENIRAAFAEHDPEAFSDREMEWVVSWCARRCSAATSWNEHRSEDARSGSSQPVNTPEAEDERDRAAVDVEDDAILLRLWQTLRGALHGKKQRNALQYQHIFVDETQDLSPVELAAVLDTAAEDKRSGARSVTLAGDVAQKLHLDNGFTSWQRVLHELRLDHVDIEPLKLSYRSTHEILDFSTHVLGPLKNEVSGQATRHGAPVELFKFGESGEAVGFLSEALRNLVRSEPLASVAVITRYPEQADLYFKGLKHGEVPNLRRVANQDFIFRPGVDVTDVKQVKGLEFDYVVLVEVNSSVYPETIESRHLLHIAGTRAAHQLWVTTCGAPSRLIPDAMVDAAN